MARSRRKTTLHEKAIEAGRRLNCNKRKKSKINLEDSPEKESIRDRHKIGPYVQGFDQLDNLGPLYKWLAKHKDQLWNDVHSKLCKELGTGVAAKHIRDHVDQAVERYPILKNGKYYASRTRFYRPYEEIREGDFYVDENGYLKQQPYKKKQKKNKVDNYTIEINKEVVFVTDHGNYTSPRVNKILGVGLPITGEEVLSGNVKVLLREKHNTIWKFSTVKEAEIPIRLRRLNSLGIIYHIYDNKEMVIGPFKHYNGKPSK